MWKDPVDLTKRKPRRLRGTPANKVLNILSFSAVAFISVPFLWYTNSTAEWVQRAKNRVLKRIEPQPKEFIRREMFSDTISVRVYEAVNDRADAKAVGDTKEKQIVEKFVVWNE